MSNEDFWRLIPTKHDADALSGIGASINGGRWNYPNTLAVYLSFEVSTTILETLTTLTPLLAYQPYSLLHVYYSGSTIKIDPAMLPSGWNRDDDPSAARAAAKTFFEERRAGGLIVPCIFLPEASNLVINPRHPDVTPDTFNVLSSRPYRFDTRWPLSR